jgi:hypothetical protein
VQKFVLPNLSQHGVLAKEEEYRRRISCIDHELNELSTNVDDADVDDVDEDVEAVIDSGSN